MEVSRSGYYKWLKNKDTKRQYQLDREELCRLVKEYHEKHKSWGYRHINRQIRKDIGWYISDNLVHKCCKFLNIKSIVRNYKYKKPGEQHVLYSNIINNNWKATKPLEKVCRDMTCIRYRSELYDTTLYLDAFNNEIISYGYTNKHNSITPYYDGLFPYLDKIKRIDYPSTLHSDQGIVYSSMAFTNAHKDYNIIRSMSRAGTPTDNPKMESINGWIKDEIENDFDIDSYPSFDEFIRTYINYYNNERLAYSLNYKTPIQYKIELGFI
jgi:transposase InsO family protein